RLHQNHVVQIESAITDFVNGLISGYPPIGRWTSSISSTPLLGFILSAASHVVELQRMTGLATDCFEIRPLPGAKFGVIARLDEGQDLAETIEALGLKPESCAMPSMPPVDRDRSLGCLRGRMA
ncbi:MAG: hypothetical protein O3A21_10065, partial [Proteobacteria bacterium]|nr:hypothetical protein [Pseudomonadota bacterium]